MSGIYDGIRQGPGGEVMGSTHAEEYRVKLRGSSLRKAVVSEVVTEVGSYDGFSVNNFSGKLKVSVMGDTLEEVFYG